MASHKITIHIYSGNIIHALEPDYQPFVLRYRRGCKLCLIIALPLSRLPRRPPVIGNRHFLPARVRTHPPGEPFPLLLVPELEVLQFYRLCAGIHKRNLVFHKRRILPAHLLQFCIEIFQPLPKGYPVPEPHLLRKTACFLLEIPLRQGQGPDFPLPFARCHPVRCNLLKNVFLFHVSPFPYSYSQSSFSGVSPDNPAFLVCNSRSPGTTPTMAKPPVPI